MRAMPGEAVIEDHDLSRFSTLPFAHKRVPGLQLRAEAALARSGFATPVRSGAVALRLRAETPAQPPVCDRRPRSDQQLAVRCGETSVLEKAPSLPAAHRFVEIGEARQAPPAIVLGCCATAGSRPTVWPGQSVHGGQSAYLLGVNSATELRRPVMAARRYAEATKPMPKLGTKRRGPFEQPIRHPRLCARRGR